MFNPDVCADVAKDEKNAFLNENIPSLTRIGVCYGENVAQSWLEIQLNSVINYTGAKPSNINQIAECARLLRTEYGYFKLTEWLMFFYNFKLGKYGRFYGSVDPLMIAESVKTFNKDRRDKLSRWQAEIDKEKREKYEQMMQKEWEKYKKFKKNNS